MATIVTSMAAAGLAAGTAPPALAADGAADRPGIVRDGDRWYLNEDLEGGAAEQSFGYGASDSLHVMGDWDGDGTDTPGVIRLDPSQDQPDAPDRSRMVWFLNDANASGNADRRVELGAGTSTESFDTPVVGDWNGDGRDGIGVVRVTEDGRSFRWILVDDLATMKVTHDFEYGEPFAYGQYDPRELREVPVVGDWDGDGVDTIGTVQQDPGDQPSMWQLRNSNSSGSYDLNYPYGNSEVRPVTGDWDGDGDDTPAVIEGTRWYVVNSHDDPTHDESFAYGRSTDYQLVWGSTDAETQPRYQQTDWTQDQASTTGSATSREPAPVNALSDHAHDDFDTLDVGLAGDALPEATVEYTDGYPHEPASGREVELEGNRFLEIVLDGATLADSGVKVTDSGDATTTISDFEVLGEQEKMVHIGVGLSTAKGTAPKVDFRLRSVSEGAVLRLDVKHHTG